MFSPSKRSHRSSRSCLCHNISVIGSVVERIDKTGLNIGTQQKILVNKMPLLQIRNGSIDIKFDSDVVIKRYGEFHCTIRCKNCKKVLNLYYGKGNAFAQFSFDRLKISDNCSEIPFQNNDGIETTPKIFAPLIKKKLEENIFLLDQQNETEDNNPTENGNFVDEILSSDDDDFDLMFSSSQAPVVGSYTESPFLFSQMVFA